MISISRSEIAGLKGIHIKNINTYCQLPPEMCQFTSPSAVYKTACFPIPCPIFFDLNIVLVCTFFSVIFMTKVLSNLIFVTRAFFTGLLGVLVDSQVL